MTESPIQLSWLPTEIAKQKCILCVDKKQFNQSQILEEDSIVTSLALDIKQLLTNQDQVIMPSWLPKVPLVI